MGEVDHKTVFIDGTKMESAAGRYTFCWRKNSEKQLGKVKKSTGTGLFQPGISQQLSGDRKGKITFVHGILTWFDAAISGRVSFAVPKTAENEKFFTD